MKFFWPLESPNKFVLHAEVHDVTKQNISHNPGKPTQPTLLHCNRVRTGGDGLRRSNLIYLYMYICKILNLPKRPWEFFAMGEKEEILSLLRFARNDKKRIANLHGCTRMYTNVHVRCTEIDDWA